MAREQKTAHNRGRPLSYPWQRWLAEGEETQLVRGRHFNCEPYSLMLQARRKAKNLGLRLRVVVHGETVTLSTKEEE